jgi:ceramide glucosyltransferase
MHVTITIFWVLAICLLAQSVAVLFGTSNFLRYVRRSRSRLLNNFTPPVALLIPCKGLEPEFEANVASYLGQDYPHYQVIFTVASADDPAYEALRTCLESASKNKLNKEEETIGPQATPPYAGVQTALVVAGYSESIGEKIHNLLEGLKAVDARAEVLAFGDSDVRPKRDWLRSLVAPFQDPTVTVSTGVGWDLPGAGFGSQVRTAWDALNVMLLGDHEYNHVCGQSMAVRSIDFKRMGVAERYWANAVSDDDALTQAVHDAGGRIWFEPRCIVACPGKVKFGEFLRCSNRQMTKERVNWPGLWWAGAATCVFSLGTALLGLIMLALPSISARQRLLMAGTLLAILLLVISKGFMHETIAKELFPEEAPTLSRYGACYWQLSLLVPWVMLLNFLLSSVTRRIEWRGTHYELKSVNETRVIRRDK